MFTKLVLALISALTALVTWSYSKRQKTKERVCMCLERYIGAYQDLTAIREVSQLIANDRGKDIRLPILPLNFPPENYYDLYGIEANNIGMPIKALWELWEVHPILVASYRELCIQVKTTSVLKYLSKIDNFENEDFLLIDYGISTKAAKVIYDACIKDLKRLNI